ncbi:MAG TPA: TetR/AcrR family transcriptional regulator, partial [Candidatus Humimicrobiaceae bacterium]|nr:TetR/AcrR family transcriptional regulator [Candidatus Humimicrobiaceae bacterium]
MNGFEKRRQQKKDSILKAAKELFNQYGYNKVTIAEIARKASVSQVSIYNFFQSKENLKQVLLKKLLNDSLLGIKQIMGSQISLKIKFEKVISLKINFLKDLINHFFPKYIESNINEEKAAAEVNKQIESQIVNLVEDGKKQGLINNSVSTQAISIFLEIIQYYFSNNPGTAA